MDFENGRKGLNTLPLICFYRGNFLFSYNYRHLRVDHNELQHIMQRERKSLIVYRLNYEWNQPSELLKKQMKIHSEAEADLFVINQYEEWTASQLNSWLEQFSRLRPFSLVKGFTPLVNQQEYAEQLSQVKAKINCGDFYQLNLSFPFAAQSNCSPLEAFAHYHQRMPGDYHAFIPSAEGTLICLSPELFLKKDHTQYTTCPIKGTSANNPDAIEALLTSQKENAELSMIVDLLRNDLNIHADIESSKVLAHRHLLHLGHLVHTYSTVQAESSAPLATILSSILPGGSISGCPKKRVIEELASLEPFYRGHYTGIVGWSHEEQAESAIVIRSFWQTHTGDIFYHAGGGIVADSQVDNEYNEVLLKARRINP